MEAPAAKALHARAAAIREQVIENLRALPPSPPENAPVAGADDNSHQEVEFGNDDIEQ